MAQGTATTAHTKTAKNIGIDVPAPATTCDDVNCPFHGSLRVRGQRISGRVVGNKMAKTAVVEHEHLRYIRKYERYERRTGRYSAHNPPCVSAQVGDDVVIMECRPLSKTKSFVVIHKKKGALRIVGEDYTEAIREERAARAEPEAPGEEPAKEAEP